jgi:hypothetical protein
MKYLLVLGCIASLFSSCIKNTPIVYDKASVVEFDAAAYNGRSGSLLYPLITRVPTGYGRAISTTLDPTVITRSIVDTLKLRINLVGLKATADLPIAVKVNTAFSSAIENTHFALISNNITIPANSNFGFVGVKILNPGAPAPSQPTFVDVVLELLGGSTVPPSQNYKYVGIRIAQ